MESNEKKSSENKSGESAVAVVWGKIVSLIGIRTYPVTKSMNYAVNWNKHSGARIA